MILELQCAGAKEAPGKAADAALRQVDTRHGDVGLDLPGDAILRCGMAFRTKACAVRTPAMPGEGHAGAAVHDSGQARKRG